MTTIEHKTLFQPLKQIQQRLGTSPVLLCTLLLGMIILTACDSFPALGTKQGQSNTFTSSSNQAISYSTSPHDVLIRTFYGGGRYGSLALAPDVSIYGDGRYTIGTDQQGQLNEDNLQQLLNTLIDTDGLLNVRRQHFSELQDQNATYLELNINGKQKELVYGTFSNPRGNQQDQDEYNRVGRALKSIVDALTGPLHHYTSSSFALLARQIYFGNTKQQVLDWPLSDFSLAQVATFECGSIPSDITSPNFEIGCLKYTDPRQAVLLHTTQSKTLQASMGKSSTAIFKDGDLFYSVILRPLLPDELPRKTLAMFGSAQLSYRGVPLDDGAVPAASS